MSVLEFLREFISKRIGAAAEEICGHFEATIVSYEEELGRQRALLENSGKPQIQLHDIEPNSSWQRFTRKRLGDTSEAICRLLEETISQYEKELDRLRRIVVINMKPQTHLLSTEPSSPSLDESFSDQEKYSEASLENFGQSDIKEEQEEMCVSLDQQQLCLKEEIESPMVTPASTEHEYSKMVIKSEQGNDMMDSQDEEESTTDEETDVKDRVFRTITSGKRRSMVWDHFKYIPPNKVRCLLCNQILSYTHNTSSMLRHVRAKHDVCQGQQQAVLENPGLPDLAKKKLLDQAVVDMIIQDGQPFSMVESEGFISLVKILDPLYKLPGRDAIKAMVGERYLRRKRVTAESLKKASTVALTADMWTSRNTEACLGVTCHYLSENLALSTVFLGVEYFPLTHTPAFIAEATSGIMAEWGITDKVCAIVTDGASNTVLSVNQLSIPHVHCFAHLLNLAVKMSISQTSELDTILTKARKIVGHFRSSWRAKEKLAIMQKNMGLPQMKLIQEVGTRWNGTFDMLQRLYEQREPLGAALASLTTNLVPFSAEEYEAINQCLKVLKPFDQATVELSGETRVSGSKVIPITKMLKHIIGVECSQMTHGIGIALASHLKNNLEEKMSELEKIPSLTVATILDPRFKNVAFNDQSHAQAAVEILSKECARMIEQEIPGGIQAQPVKPSSNQSLWALLDTHVVSQQQQVDPASATADAEIQRYLKEQFLPRSDDPLKYWASRKTLYPTLWKLARKYLSIPASSVPCERIFSKAGELVHVCLLAARLGYSNPQNLNLRQGMEDD